MDSDFVPIVQHVCSIDSNFVPNRKPFAIISLRFRPLFLQQSKCMLPCTPTISNTLTLTSPHPHIPSPTPSPLPSLSPSIFIFCYYDKMSFILNKTTLGMHVYQNYLWKGTNSRKKDRGRNRKGFKGAVLDRGRNWKELRRDKSMGTKLGLPRFKAYR